MSLQCKNIAVWFATSDLAASQLHSATVASVSAFPPRALTRRCCDAQLYDDICRVTVRVRINRNMVDWAATIALTSLSYAEHYGLYRRGAELGLFRQLDETLLGSLFNALCGTSAAYACGIVVRFVAGT